MTSGLQFTKQFKWLRESGANSLAMAVSRRTKVKIQDLGLGKEFADLA